MNIHDATELAYKNGYEQAIKDLCFQFPEFYNEHQDTINKMLEVLRPLKN